MRVDVLLYGEKGIAQLLNGANLNVINCNDFAETATLLKEIQELRIFLFVFFLPSGSGYELARLAKQFHPKCLVGQSIPLPAWEAIDKAKPLPAKMDFVLSDSQPVVDEISKLLKRYEEASFDCDGGEGS